MCLFGSSSKPEPAPKPPAPAKAPATLDFSDMETTPSSSRKRRAKGKRGVRNMRTNTTGMNMGGSSTPSLNIPSNKGGK